MNQLTEEQKSLYMSSYGRPKVIVSAWIGDASEPIVLGLSVLPSVGACITVVDQDGGALWVTVKEIQHWAVRLRPGQTEFQEHFFCDAVLICEESKLNPDPICEENEP